MVEADPKQFLIQGDVYEVEKLVGAKIVKGKKLYRVRWRGYGRESDTLEPEENLLSCKDMIQDLEEKIEARLKKKNKKLLLGATGKESKDETSLDSCKAINISEWQAAEVQNEGNSKDTFWRDFDEGKINVSDKDMYSKVKERAARTVQSGEGGKVIEVVQKENPILLLCPKVVLKRKPIIRNPCGYKSSLQVKLDVSKKRKKYDVLRDYRKRRNRVHRKINSNENQRCGRRINFQDSDKPEAQAASNILQELVINDETIPSDFGILSFSKSEIAKLQGSLPKSPTYHERRMSDKSKSPTEPTGKQASRTSPKSSCVTAMNPSVQRLFSSLLNAVTKDQLEKVERLCTNTHVINVCQEDGMTPLMIASKLGFYNIVKVLLKANAHKDRQNKDGETALMLACQHRQSKIAKLLLEHGANFALMNSEGVGALRITKTYGSETVMHSILVEHIMRMVSEFESKARRVYEHFAEIKYALLPVQCFSLNEGPKFSLEFQYHIKLESPGKNGKVNVLFIARSTIRGNRVECLFSAESLDFTVTINEVKQERFLKDGNSIFKMKGLQNGNNKVLITTSYYPESEVKLIVCAYRVHRKISGFPAQKLRSDFQD